MLLGLAEGMKHAGANVRAVDYADRVLRIDSIPNRLRACAYAVKAHALEYVETEVGADQADEAGAEAYRLGTQTGEYSAAVSGLSARSVAARRLGRLSDALAHAEAAVELVDRFGGTTVHRYPSVFLGAALIAADRFSDAERVLVKAQRDADQLGTVWSKPLSHYQLASLLAARGRLQDAVSEADLGLAAAGSGGARQLCGPLHALLATLHADCDELPTAEQHLVAMHDLLDAGITVATELVSRANAVVQLAAANPTAAWDSLAPVCDVLARRPLLLTYDPGCTPIMVRTALAMRDRERAQIVEAVARKLAEANESSPSLVGVAAHARGLLHSDADPLRQAVAVLRRGPRPLILAAALEDLAMAEHRSGSAARALAEIDQAISIVSRCGARHALARLLAHRQTMSRPAASVTVDIVPGSLGTLTPAQSDVAHLVALGLTNQAIATKIGKTEYAVDSRLRRIYRALGINSRAELARLVGNDSQGPDHEPRT